MDAVLHALADGSRRTVLEALRQGEATVSELAALLPIARPGVSRHLRVLREAGLVELRQQAQWRCTACGLNRWPRSTNGWGATGHCGSTDWMPCTPR